MPLISIYDQTEASNKQAAYYVFIITNLHKLYNQNDSLNHHN